MTETKQKILSIIEAWANSAVSNKRSGASVYDPYNAEELSDALIEAGIGNVKEIGHRAEVAERALKLACKTIAPSYVDTAKLYFEIFVNQAEKELAEETK